MATVDVVIAPAESENALLLRLVSLDSQVPMPGILFQIGRKAACQPVVVARKSHGPLPLSVLLPATESYRVTKKIR